MKLIAPDDIPEGLPDWSFSRDERAFVVRVLNDPSIRRLVVQTCVDDVRDVTGFVRLGQRDGQRVLAAYVHADSLVHQLCPEETP